MIPRHWSADYVGLPFADNGRARDGADCWGLARLVYADLLGVDLPDYAGAYASTEERAEVAAVIDHASRQDIWTRVDQARPYDILVFRLGALGSHVGVAVTTGRMLHMAEHRHAMIEDFTQPRWASRLTGIFRHCGMEM